MDKRDQFSISCSYNSEYPDGLWIIQQAEWCTFRPHVDRDGGYWSFHPHDGNRVWTRPCRKDDPEEGYPADLRAEFERLIEYDPDYDPSHQPTLGEACFADEEDGGGFNQPCKFGNLAEGHAVYCTNSKWLYGPTKCRRTWYTGGERRDEDCEGYAPNPKFNPSH
jgi:hypothetical protein